MSKLLLGVKVKPLIRHYDDRGSFTELMRQDWRELLGDDSLVQANLSVSHPGIVRAWHRHKKHQKDYMICLRGTMKICIYKERGRKLDEIISTGERLQVVRVLGGYWHGFKALGNKPAWLLYFVTNLYDYEDPDEEHIPWNDPSIIPASINGNTDDPRVGKVWNWNHPPHR